MKVSIIEQDNRMIFQGETNAVLEGLGYIIPFANKSASADTMVSITVGSEEDPVEIYRGLISRVDIATLQKEAAQYVGAG